MLRGGSRSTPAVEPSGKPFDLDVGPGPDGAPLVVYARAGDLFQFDPATGARAAARRGQHARHRAQPEHPPQRARASSARSTAGRSSTSAGRRTRAASRARASSETLGVDGLELSARGLFVTYRTDIVPTCCTPGDALPRRRRQAAATSSPSAAAARTSARSSRPTVVRPQHLLRPHEPGLRPGQPLLPLRPALAQAVRRARHEPRAVADLARRPLPDEPRDRDRRHRAPRSPTRSASPGPRARTSAARALPSTGSTPSDRHQGVVGALEIAAGVAVLAGAALQSATGFGFALTSAPLVFAAAEPEQAVGLLIVLGLIVNLMTLGHRGAAAAAARARLADDPRPGGSRASWRACSRCARSTRRRCRSAVTLGVFATLAVRALARRRDATPARAGRRAWAAPGHRLHLRRADHLDEHLRPAGRALHARARRDARCRRATR